MTCSHEWERYTNLPGGMYYYYWRCRLCGVIGYAKGNGYQGKDPEYRRVRVVVCHKRGCSNPAVDRLPGYVSITKLRWVCVQHWCGRSE